MADVLPGAYKLSEQEGCTKFGSTSEKIGYQLMIGMIQSASAGIERTWLKFGDSIGALPKLLILAQLLVLALLMGGLSVVNPLMLGAVIVVLGIVFAGISFISQPQKALISSFYLVFLSETKFRIRDAHDLIAGNVDAQIIFELALYGIILLVTLINLFLNLHKYRKPTLVEYALFSYVAMVLASILWSYSPLFTAVRAIQTAILCALPFVAVRTLGPQVVLRTVTITISLHVLIFASMALVFPWANGTRIDYFGIARFSWFGAHPIPVAALAAEAAILIISEALFIPGSWRRRIMGVPLWLYITLPLIFTLLATRSRGPLFAFIVTVFALWVKRYVNPWIVGFAGYIVVTLSLVLLVFSSHFTVALEHFLDSRNPVVAFLSRGQNPEIFLSMTGRAELWSFVIFLVSERPLLGYGFGASRASQQVLIDNYSSWGAHAHNGLAQALLNVGIVGTAFLLFVLSKTLLSSLLQAYRGTGSATWHQTRIFGLVLFLMINSISVESFAGFPGHDPFLLFILVFTHEELKLTARSLDKK